MNLTAFLTALGGALEAGGVATKGAVSTMLHIAGALALYLARSPLGGKAPTTSDAPPTGA